MLIPGQISGKNVLLRADLDVSVKEGRVTDPYRLETLLPTLKLCLKYAQSVILIGHKGRPEVKNREDSLHPVKDWLERAIHQPICFIDSGFSPGEWQGSGHRFIMLENLRFHPGENNLSREFARDLTPGRDLYLYEAFAAYRPSASLQIIPELLPTLTGIQFDREVETLGKISKNPATPSLLIISGAKEDKLAFVDKFVDKFDEILVGGKLASLVLRHANVIPASLTPDGLDIDSASITRFSEKIKIAQSIIVSGPPGKFEDNLHAAGTKAIFQAAKSSPAFTVVGGGDTLAAVKTLGFSYSDFDFVSTGGGAMLEFLATGTHPLLSKLETYKQKR
ncbi:phosphoglycerate kinase [Candidatus Collierbacteria bacterium]|nr:phosphoglycerate kinase [Candidatus Collierbacteria bacterium]